MNPRNQIARQAFSPYMNFTTELVVCDHLPLWRRQRVLILATMRMIQP